MLQSCHPTSASNIHTVGRLWITWTRSENIKIQYNVTIMPSHIHTLGRLSITWIWFENIKIQVKHKLMLQSCHPTSTHWVGCQSHGNDLEISKYNTMNNQVIEYPHQTSTHWVDFQSHGYDLKISKYNIMLQLCHPTSTSNIHILGRLSITWIWSENIQIQYNVTILSSDIHIHISHIG